MGKKQTTEIPEAKIRIAIWELKSGKTKKKACETLGIAYNTTRLGKIIEEFKEKLIREKELREKKKGKPLSEDDIKFIISSYLEGQPQYKIADQLYISSAKVKKTLLENSIPIRGRGKKTPAQTDHIKQDLTIKFQKGDRVFVPILNETGIIHEVWDEDYVDYFSEGYPKSVELSEWKNLKQDQEPKMGVHYESYWVLPNGDMSWKTSAVQNHVSMINQLIIDTGREYYKLWVTETKQTILIKI